MNKDDLAAKLAKATLDDMARPMSNKDGGDTCSRCPELLPWDALYLDNGERLCNHCEDRANMTPRSIAARLVEWADDAGADGMAGTATLCRQAADAITTLSAENERLEAACQQYLDAFDAGTGTVYVEPVIRQALAGDTNHG